MYFNLDHITTLKQLVQVAVDDMKAVKANPNYVFDTGIWHEPQFDDTCTVCVAGAVIAGTLGGDITKHLRPCNFGGETRIKLELLDELRVKSFSLANEILVALNWPPLTIEQVVYLSQSDAYVLTGDQKAWEGFLDVL